MKHGFIKTAAMTPKIRVADTGYNADRIIEQIDEAVGNGAKIIVFPELCLTGYTCQDLFWQETLLEGAKEALKRIEEHSEKYDALIFVGLPLEKNGKLYNVAAVIHNGAILAFIPKTVIPNYAEYSELRYFAPAEQENDFIDFDDTEIPFGTKMLFRCDAVEGLVVACEICEDLWAVQTPSTSHALAGANVIVNLSASNESVGKEKYRTDLICAASARLIAGYVYAGAGEGESTQDLVFSGHNMIAENGTVLVKAPRFTSGAV